MIYTSFPLTDSFISTIVSGEELNFICTAPYINYKLFKILSLTLRLCIKISKHYENENMKIKHFTIYKMLKVANVLLNQPTVSRQMVNILLDLYLKKKKPMFSYRKQGYDII